MALEKLIGPNQACFQQEQTKVEEMKVVKTALGDLGPKSANAVNPNPGKTGQESLAKKKMHGEFKLITLSTGYLFGEEDVVAQRPCSVTARCVSSAGMVYRIDASEYFRRIECFDETKRMIRQALFEKQIKIQERSDMIEGIYNIKPSDIIAHVALEKSGGEDTAAATSAPKTDESPGRAKSKSPQARRQSLSPTSPK